MTFSEGKEYLKALKKAGNLERQGITFHTSKNSYLYDAGTGKVALLDKDSIPILSALFDNNIDLESFESLLENAKNVDSIVCFIKKEHLLMRPEKTEFFDWSSVMTEEALQCQQLIVELTGQCNLRCKYCIYNDH